MISPAQDHQKGPVFAGPFLLEFVGLQHATFTGKNSTLFRKIGVGIGKDYRYNSHTNCVIDGAEFFLTV
ncbi:MAG: hypothetical protein RI997_940 [Pseudomonadota bacterium]